MKTAMRFVVFALVFVGITFSAGCERDEASTDGNPFGLDLDKHPSEYGCVQVPNKKLFCKYRCNTLPESLPELKPHPEIVRFDMQYVDGIGICNVKALGKSFSHGSFGAAVKKRGEAVARQLARKYGDHTYTLNLDPNEHQFLWVQRQGFKPVGDVSFISVDAKVSNLRFVPGREVPLIADSEMGRLDLYFSFKRNSQCQKIIDPDFQKKLEELKKELGVD